MQLNPIKANMTELAVDGMQVLFSYKTPVAVLVLEPENGGWHQYKTDKFWSQTTSRHINQWNPRGGAFGLKPQAWFDNLIAGVK